MDWRAIKKKVTKQGLELLEEKIMAIKGELDLLNESAEADTKSSMGDKYETGREMIQQERNKLNTQLGQLQTQKAMLSQLDLDKSFTSVAQGSLVVTDQMNYYLSTGLGPVQMESTIFMLSAAAPVAQAMKGKKAGEQIRFNGNEIKILEVI